MSSMAGFNIEPYQFEPTYPEGEEPSSSDSECEEEEQVIEERVGNTEWCRCENCHSMDTTVESVCCQELDVLNEKFDVAGWYKICLNIIKL